MAKTRKNIPWSGWSKKAPSYKQRRTMMENCGRRCFLGPKKSLIFLFAPPTHFFYTPFARKISDS